MIRGHERFVFVALNCGDSRKKSSSLLDSCSRALAGAQLLARRQLILVLCLVQRELSSRQTGVQRGVDGRRDVGSGSFTTLGSSEAGELGWPLSSRPPGDRLLDVGWLDPHSTRSKS